MLEGRKHSPRRNQKRQEGSRAFRVNVLHLHLLSHRIDRYQHHVDHYRRWHRPVFYGKPGIPVGTRSCVHMSAAEVVDAAWHPHPKLGLFSSQGRLFDCGPWPDRPAVSVEHWEKAALRKR